MLATPLQELAGQEWKDKESSDFLKSWSSIVIISGALKKNAGAWASISKGSDPVPSRGSPGVYAFKVQQVGQDGEPLDRKQ